MQIGQRTSCLSDKSPSFSDESKYIIIYCRIGERSSRTWFVLKYLLGYPNVKNYDGSVTVVPLADPHIMTPFLKKQIDGAWVPEPMGTRLAG